MAKTLTQLTVLVYVDTFIYTVFTYEYNFKLLNIYVTINTVRMKNKKYFRKIE